MVTGVEGAVSVGVSEGADACPVEQLIDSRVRQSPSIQQTKAQVLLQLIQTNNPYSPTFLMRIPIVRVFQAAFRFFTVLCN